MPKPDRSVFTHDALRAAASDATRFGLSGIWPALTTPLAADGAIETTLFATHAQRLLAAGCGGLTPFGTTGEGPSFSVAERCAAVDALVAHGVPGARLLVSTSAASVSDALALTRHAQAIGAWGVLLAPPFFFKGVADAGVLDFYRAVLDAVADGPLRVVPYHIPQLVGVGLSHAVIAALIERYGERIVALKDSSGDRAHALALARAFMPPLGVHVGHEPDLPHLGRLGSGGAVSGLANLMPRTVRHLVLEPDSPQAVADLARIERLLKVLGGFSLVPAIKALLALGTGQAAWRRVRAPLVALDDDEMRALAQAVDSLRLDAAAD